MLNKLDEIVLEIIYHKDVVQNDQSIHDLIYLAQERGHINANTTSFEVDNCSFESIYSYSIAKSL